MIPLRPLTAIFLSDIVMDSLNQKYVGGSPKVLLPPGNRDSSVLWLPAAAPNIHQALQH